VVAVQIFYVIQDRTLFLKLFKEWEATGLVQETLKLFAVRENSNCEERYKKKHYFYEK
jgi:hypothetical protein